MNLRCLALVSILVFSPRQGFAEEFDNWPTEERFEEDLRPESEDGEEIDTPEFQLEPEDIPAEEETIDHYGNTDSYESDPRNEETSDALLEGKY